MKEYSDKQILKMFSGNESDKRGAFEILVRKYSERIYWTVRKILVNHQDSDDVVQEIFIKLWDSLDTFRGESQLYTWIYRISVNEALAFVRKGKRRMYVNNNDTSLQLELTKEEGHMIDSDELTRAIEEAVATLPEKQRLVFNLRYYDEMPYKEMAGILDTSEGALKASYHHAAKKVEEYLLEKEFLIGD